MSMKVVRRKDELLSLLREGWDLQNTGGIDARYIIMGGEPRMLRTVDVRAVDAIRPMLQSAGRTTALATRYELRPIPEA